MLPRCLRPPRRLTAVLPLVLAVAAACSDGAPTVPGAVPGASGAATSYVVTFRDGAAASTADSSVASYRALAGAVLSRARAAAGSASGPRFSLSGDDAGVTVFQHALHGF
ncbi:MAG: hypothetical protein JO040_11070, partial [Gemmatimonadetes bacterium]|nr:hypothetical protein [Gemmatimonadota bacterium]